MATDIRREGEEFSRYVGAQLQGEITKRQFTVAGITRNLGMDRSTVTRYLKGERAFPIDVLYAITEAIGADPGRVVDDAYRWFLEDHPRADLTPVLDVVRSLTPSHGIPIEKVKALAAHEEPPRWREQTDQ